MREFVELDCDLKRTLDFILCDMEHCEGFEHRTFLSPFFQFSSICIPLFFNYFFK